MRESVRVLVEGSRPIRRRLRAQVCGDLMEGPVNKRFGFGARRGWGRDEFRDVGLRLDENARPRRIPRQRIPLRPSLRPAAAPRARCRVSRERPRRDTRRPPHSRGRFPELRFLDYRDFDPLGRNEKSRFGRLPPLPSLFLWTDFPVVTRYSGRTISSPRFCMRNPASESGGSCQSDIPNLAGVQVCTRRRSKLDTVTEVNLNSNVADNGIGDIFNRSDECGFVGEPKIISSRTPFLIPYIYILWPLGGSSWSFSPD